MSEEIGHPTSVFSVLKVKGTTQRLVFYDVHIRDHA